MHTTYSAQYRELWSRHWWWQSRHQVVMRRLEQVCQSDGRMPHDRELLDVGCAGGVAFDDFSRFGNVQGVEPDGRLIDRSSPWSAHIENASFDDGYEPESQFDVILMLDVLEHIEDDAGALARVFRLLRPGASAILTVPALPSLWSVHDEVNFHFRRYTRASLVRRFNAAGMEIAEVRYMFGWPLALMYLRRALSQSQPAQYRVSIPVTPLNAAMRFVSRCEEAVCSALRRGPLLGSSLLAIVRRPASADSSRTAQTSAMTLEV